MKIRVFGVFCLLVVLLILGSGCIGSDESTNETKSDNETKLTDITGNHENLSDALGENTSELSSFSKYYSKENLQFEANVSPYSLPLTTSEISNYKEFTQNISLTSESKDLLYKNGFVVLENKAAGNIFQSGPTRVDESYKNLKVAGIPIFITSDSLLHLYHIQFDETLKRIEEKELFDELWKLDKALLEASIDDYNKSVEDNASEELTEAARRNVVYFSVALSLLEPKPEQIAEKLEIAGTGHFNPQDAKQYNIDIPSFVEKDVEAKLRLIEAQKREGDEDYSQYIPRGHYTSSEKLKNYFKAMMWHGRISMLLNPESISAEDPEKEAKIQTIQAFLISDHFDKDKTIREKWDKIYEVTAFYVGFSDDLGPYEYVKALDNVFGENRSEINFDNESLMELKNELERSESPKIYGGTGKIIQAGSETENETLEATKGFRFMGQRYTPDSHILQKLHPPALNIMDLLGSEQAKKYLKNQGVSESEEYKKAHLSLENEFGAFDEEDWNKNLYWAQLYTLKPLLVNYSEGYPTFMQTEAWEDKQLNTALSSWTELRHDTILYSKQAYLTGAFYYMNIKPAEGYVEPVPEFYARMLALTKMAHTGLVEMDAIDEQSDTDFSNLENTLEKLLEISTKELENKELTDEEYEFIRNFGENISPMLKSVDVESQTSVMVADVYTSTLDGVLEEGTGKLDVMVVAYKQPDGSIVLGAGPVMSYYEFWQPSGERLTDEEWKDMLENNPPERPEWIESFKV